MSGSCTAQRPLRVDCGQISLGSEQPSHSADSQPFTPSVASRPTRWCAFGHRRPCKPWETQARNDPDSKRSTTAWGRTRSKRSHKPDCQRISEAANRKRYANAGRRANRMGATDAGLSSARHRSTVRSMIKWRRFFLRRPLALARRSAVLAALFESERPPSLERWCDRRLIARSHVPTTRFQSS